MQVVQEWASVARALGYFSLVFYLGLIATVLLLFVFNDWY